MVTEIGEPEGTRRRFLTWFLSTSVGLFLIAVLYPVSRYLMPPPLEESPARTVRLTVTPEEVKPNSGQIFSNRSAKFEYTFLGLTVSEM
jgi:hypothetical protein